MSAGESFAPLGAWTEHSTAVLDATLLRVWTEPAALARVLERRGIALSARARRGKRQPLLVELWQVRQGQLMLGALPLRDACALAWAGACAAPAALAQAVLPPTTRAAHGTREERAADFVRRTSTIGASLGREGADALIARLGHFHEVMLSVPDVELPNQTGPCRLVLGMFTDSRISQLGAAGFGFRLGKRIARITRLPFATYEVSSATNALLGARFDASPWSRDPECVPASWQAWLQQPLLGVQRAGTGSLSRLAYGWHGCTRARVKRGELFMSEALTEGLCDEVAAIGRGQLRGAEGLHVRDLRVRLSYPKALRWGNVARATGRARA
jgi:hypothetical protein